MAERKGTPVVKVRHREPAKGADRPEPKWHAGRIVEWNPRRRSHRDPPAYRAKPPHPLFPIGQQGKPHSPRRCEAAVSRPQGRGWRRGERSGGASEGGPVIGRGGRTGPG